MKTLLVLNDARRIGVDDPVAGSHRRSLDELTQWTTCADTALVV